MKAIVKGLMTLLLVFPLAFSSCLSKSDPTPDPLAPGIAIYNAASMRNQLAMVPSNVAFRLGIILSEAAKAGLEGDAALTVKDNGVLLTHMLFSPYDEITTDGTKYIIKFQEGMQDSYYFGFYEGSVIVETGGKLIDEEDAEWSVSTSGLKVYINTGYNYTTYNYASSSNTQILNSGVDNYRIELENFNMADASSNKMLDNWGGSFLLTGKLQFNYEQRYKLSGEASDRLMGWSLQNATYKGVDVANYNQVNLALLSGEIVAKFVAGAVYDTETYPSPTVKVIFSNDGNSYRIDYNGQTNL